MANKKYDEDINQTLIEYSQELSEKKQQQFILKVENNDEFRKKAYEAVSNTIFYYSLMISHALSDKEQDKEIIYNKFKETKKQVEKSSEFKEIRNMKIFFLNNYSEVEEFDKLPNDKKENFIKEIKDSVSKIDKKI